MRLRPLRSNRTETSNNLHSLFPSCDTGDSLSPNASNLLYFSGSSHVPSGEIVLLIRPEKKIVVDFQLKIDKNIRDDKKIISIFVPASGKMQEWLIWHAWKACEPLKGSGGSNPPLSAENEIKGSWTGV